MAEQKINPFILEDYERDLDPGTPEKALLAAIIERTILDYQLAVCHLAMVKGEMGDKYHSSHLNWRLRKDLKDIPKYVYSESEDYFSFLWVCKNLSEENPEVLIQKTKNKLVELNNALLRVTDIRVYL